jgi:hydroxyacylglutathione hydrolase
MFCRSSSGFSGLNGLTLSQAGTIVIAYPVFGFVWRSILAVEIARVVSLPFEENSFVACVPGGSKCFIIDPGLEPERIVAHLDEKGLTPTDILITHGHGDHIGGIAALKERWPACRLVIGKDEAAKLTDPVQNLSLNFGFSLTCPPPDVLVDEGHTLGAAGFDVLVRAVPGHSSGHVVYQLTGESPLVVFVGDVIFAGSVGRTDLPGGSFEQLAAGIRQKLFTLPDDTVLWPGHGSATTVGREKRTNPYVGE